MSIIKSQLASEGVRGGVWPKKKVSFPEKEGVIKEERVGRRGKGEVVVKRGREEGVKNGKEQGERSGREEGVRRGREDVMRRGREVTRYREGRSSVAQQILDIREETRGWLEVHFPRYRKL